MVGFVLENFFIVSFLLNVDFAFLYIHTRGGNITIVSIGSQISCLFSIIQLTRYIIPMVLHVFQGYANGHGTISQTLIKHSDRVNCVKWISNSNSKYIITLKACNFLCYLFHKFNTFFNTTFIYVC